MQARSGGLAEGIDIPNNQILKYESRKPEVSSIGILPNIGGAPRQYRG
jgi:hypothetical protein